MPSWRTIFSRPMDGISALQITCAAGPGPKGGPDARNGRERGARRPSQDLNRACRQARRGLDRACGRVRRETTTVLTGHDDLRRPRLGLPQQAAATGSVATRHRSRLRTALTHLPGASPARDAVQNRAGAYVARGISQDLQFRPPHTLPIRLRVWFFRLENRETARAVASPAQMRDALPSARESMPRASSTRVAFKVDGMSKIWLQGPAG